MEGCEEECMAMSTDAHAHASMGVEMRSPGTSRSIWPIHAAALPAGMLPAVAASTLAVLLVLGFNLGALPLLVLVLVLMAWSGAC